MGFCVSMQACLLPWSFPQKMGKTLFPCSLCRQGTECEGGKHPALGHVLRSCPGLTENPTCCLIGYKINSFSPALPPEVCLGITRCLITTILYPFPSLPSSALQRFLEALLLPSVGSLEACVGNRASSIARRLSRPYAESAY